MIFHSNVSLPEGNNRCWPPKLKRTWSEYVWVVQSPRTNAQVTALGMARYCFLCNLHLILLGSKYLFADPIQEAAHCAGKTAHGWINFTFWLEIKQSLWGNTIKNTCSLVVRCNPQLHLESWWPKSTVAVDKINMRAISKSSCGPVLLVGSDFNSHNGLYTDKDQ